RRGGCESGVHVDPRWVRRAEGVSGVAQLHMRVWSLWQRDIERSHRTVQDETCAGYVGLRRREESADDELIRVPCGRRARSGQVDVQTVAVVHESVVVRVDEPKGAVPGDADREGTHFVYDRKLRVRSEEHTS